MEPSIPGLPGGYMRLIAPAPEPSPTPLVDMMGLASSMKTVSDRLASGDVKMQELEARRRGVLSRVYDTLAARGGISPETAQRVQQDPKEALLALALTALAAQSGARNAGAAGQAFLQNRAQSAALQTQDVQTRLDQEYLRRKNELDAQLQALNLEYEDAGNQMAQLSKEQIGLGNNLEELAKQDALNQRNQANIDDRQSRAELAGEQKLQQIAAQSQGQLDIAAFKAQNPEVLQTYGAILNTVGQDAADRYMQGVALTPEFKNALTNAKTQTEEQTLPGKLKLNKAQVKYWESRPVIERQKAERSWAKYSAQLETDGEKEAFARANGIIDADIEALKTDIKGWSDQISYFDSLAKDYDAQRKAAEKADDGEAWLIADKGYREAQKNREMAFEQRTQAQARLSEKQKGKAQAPSGAGYANIKWSSRAKPDFEAGTLSGNMLRDIDSTAQSLGFTITIGTADTGHSDMTAAGYPSRHKKGQAVDITHINGIPVSTPEGKKLADQYVAGLVKQGAVRNRESGNQKSVLWQMKGHYDHIHYSNNG